MEHHSNIMNSIEKWRLAVEWPIQAFDALGELHDEYAWERHQVAHRHARLWMLKHAQTTFQFPVVVLVPV
jgi:hypothetical protein